MDASYDNKIGESEAVWSNFQISIPNFLGPICIFIQIL